MVTQRVVHVLEAVEVDEHHRDVLLVAFREKERLVDAVVEERPVGEIGERVVEGLMPVLCRLLPQALGRARDDAEEDEVEQGEAAEQKEVRRPRLFRDRRRNGLVGQVDLEYPGGGGGGRKVQRHVHLEQLSIRLVAHALRVVELADLGRDLAVERLRELVLDPELPVDQGTVVRVDDSTVAAPDLDADDFSADQIGAEGLVEQLQLCGRQPVTEILGREERLDAEAGAQDRRLPRVLERSLLDLTLQIGREHEAESHDRQQARDRELSDEAEPRPQWQTRHLTTSYRELRARP